MRALTNALFIGVLTFPLYGCGGVNLDPKNPATANDLITGLGLEEIPYIKDDTFIANPQGLLGQVVEIRKKDGACPASVNGGLAEFTVMPVTGYKIDPQSILSAPLKRDSQIVTHEGSANVAFLSYLSASLDAKSVYSIILFDQAAARVDDKDPSWAPALNTWKDANAKLFTDPDICYLWVVKGFVQKNIVRKKFTDVSTEAKGGAYGVNVNGKYHTSSDDYSVDVKFGLSPGILRRPTDVPQAMETDVSKQTAPTEADLKVLVEIDVIKRKQ